jgi:hypothetical protein
LWKPTKEGNYNLTINATDAWENPATIDVGLVKVEKKPLSVSLIAAIVVAVIVAMIIILAFLWKKKTS